MKLTEDGALAIIRRARTEPALVWAKRHAIRRRFSELAADGKVQKGRMPADDHLFDAMLAAYVHVVEVGVTIDAMEADAKSAPGPDEIYPLFMRSERLQRLAFESTKDAHAKLGDGSTFSWDHDIDWAGP